MTITSAASTAKRTVPTFESYIGFAAKALQQSRTSLDTLALIQLAYGDDTSHIGGNAMLMRILESTLDNITRENITKQLTHYGTSDTSVISDIVIEDGKARDEKINENELTTFNRSLTHERLNEIDHVISFVINWEEKRQQIDGLDSKSAQESVYKNLLPEGMTMKDVIAYREQKERHQAISSLRVQLKQIEGEISDLRSESNRKEEKIRKQFLRIEKVEQGLEIPANACSMISI